MLYKSKPGHFLFVAMLFFCSVASYSQCELSVEKNLFFTDVIVSHNGISHNVRSMIDTGASVCVIDSAFAVDSCHIVLIDKNLKISNHSNRFVNVNDINLDSISFGGITYPLTRCVVVDFAGKTKNSAPKFIIGGDILKRELWSFDLKNKIMSRSNGFDKNRISKVIKWKSHDDYSDASLNSIYFKGKVAGKKTRILFDTGSSDNFLPLNYGVNRTKTIVHSFGEISKMNVNEKFGLCENVYVEVPNLSFSVDFILYDNVKYPRVNTGFLSGKIFALDYKRKCLYILNE